MPSGAYEIGSVYTRLGYEVDPRELDRYQAELAKVEARVARKDKFRAQLGGDYDERAFRAYQRDLDKAERDQAKLSQSTGRLGDRFDRTGDSAARLGHGLRGLFDTAGKITAIGVATQALSALGAAAGAAVAGVAPVSGALAAVPAAASAAAQGMGVVKLATVGLADALEAGKAAQDGSKESAEKYRESLGKLTPEAQKFAKATVENADKLQSLQRAAGGLFGGASTGLTAALRNFPILERGVASTSKVIGDLADQAGRLIGSRGFGRDLETQMGRNDVTIRRTGQGALNLAGALQDVTISAGPLVNKITAAGLKLTELSERQTRAGRESGALARFFEQTSIQGSRFARIAADVGGALINIGKAAYPLGNELLRAITLNADKFRQWTDSARGQNTIRDYFARARPAIFELGRLIEDTTRTFFRLGSGDQVAPLLHILRTRLLPAFERLVDSTTGAFGPAFLNALTEALLLFSKLAGSSGPLVALAQVLGTILARFNDLLEAFPLLNTALVSIVAVGGIAKALQIGAAVTGVKSLIGWLTKARTAAAQTAVASTAAGGAAGTAGAAGGVRGLIGRGAGPAGIAATLGLGALFSGIQGAREERAVKGLTEQIEKLVSTRNLTGLRMLRREFDQYSSFPGGIDKARAAIGRAEGAVKDLRRATEGSVGEMRRSFNNLERFTTANMGDIRAVVARNMRRIRDRLGEDSEAGRKAVAENFRTAADAVRRQMRRGEVTTREGMKAIRGFLTEELQIYGLSLRAARNIAKGDGSGGQYGDPDANRGREGGAGRQRGGWLGAGRGSIGQDTIPVGPGYFAASGEYLAQGPGGRGAVVNRHQAPIVELALMRGGYTLDTLPRDSSALGMIEAALADWGGLDAVFSAVPRPHMLQAGGQIVPVPGFPGERAARSILSRIAQVAKRFGLTLTDAFGPGHKSPGHTVTGTAADFAGGDRAMDAAVRALVGQGYLVGYDGRFGSQAWPGHGPSYVAGSNAHLHVEFGSGRGGGATLPAAPTLPRPRIAGGGQVGRAVQGALDMARGGAQRLLERASMASLEVPVGGGGGGAANAGRIRSWLAAGLRLAGQPATAANIATLFGRVMQESGGNPNAQNDWDSNAAAGTPSIGLLQTIGPTFAAYKVPGYGNIRNPVHNVAAAVRYMLARYGKLVGRSPTGAGYQRGGRLGRYLQGGGRYGPNTEQRRVSVRRKFKGAAEATEFASRLNGMQTDRVEDFDQAIGRIDSLQRDYGQAERRFNLSEEEFVSEKDGTVNTQAVAKHARELKKLLVIRDRIIDAAERARRIARRVTRTYRKILRGLRDALRHASKKKRPGLRAMIGRYEERLGEWGVKARDAGEDLQDYRLDRRELKLERDAVLATKAEDRGSDADPGDLGDLGSDIPDLGGTETAAAGPSPDQQAIIDAATRKNEQLTQDLAAASASLAAFTSSGDLGSGRGSSALGSTLVDAAGGAGGAARAGVPGAFGTVTSAGQQTMVLRFEGFPPTGAQLRDISDTVVDAFQTRPAQQPSQSTVGG